jgi:biopolymer transport protein TolQ
MLFFASNPFFSSYVESDFFGKLIFVGLFSLSALSWTVLAHKIWMFRISRRVSEEFSKLFLEHRRNPLTIAAAPSIPPKEVPHPFWDLYRLMKNQTIEMLNKNHHFLQQHGQPDLGAFLSPTDLKLLESQLYSSINKQVEKLERYIYLLSITVSLAPFLGLLGTVWGILLTFSQLQSSTGGGSAAVLGGISLALGTTVMGLLVAIPALVGFHYLKSAVGSFEIQMEAFSNEMLAAVEIHYRKVDVA